MPPKIMGKSMFTNHNEQNRQLWLSKTLNSVPAGFRLLDAGAGECKNKKHCGHLAYVSQDFGEYTGGGDEGVSQNAWDATQVDIISDITEIPEQDASFDVILCSEVFEHIPDPVSALAEFQRLLKPKGLLILTAPFASNVHMAPYHFSSGFSKYWYNHHLKKFNFDILELTANGTWYDVLLQETRRLPALERSKKVKKWPLAYIPLFFLFLYFGFTLNSKRSDLSCFGWHCIAQKQ